MECNVYVLVKYLMLLLISIETSMGPHCCGLELKFCYWTGGMLISRLLQWMRLHFVEADHMATDVLREDQPHLSQSFWPAVSVTWENPLPPFPVASSSPSCCRSLVTSCKAACLKLWSWCPSILKRAQSASGLSSNSWRECQCTQSVLISPHHVVSCLFAALLCCVLAVFVWFVHWRVWFQVAPLAYGMHAEVAGWKLCGSSTLGIYLPGIFHQVVTHHEDTIHC